MRKSLSLLWATVLAACVPGSVVTKDGCVVGPDEQSAWETAAKANTAKAYKAYLKHYPRGCYVARASAKLKVPVAPPPVVKVKPAKTKTGGGGGGGIYK